MLQKIVERNGLKVAEIVAERPVIESVQDALDLMANCRDQGAERIILRSEHLAPEFFDLSSGLAGEVLQKFSNYQMKLAIVGDLEASASESLKAFMRESNRGGQVAFVLDPGTALRRLTER